jgi:hypothetical protein
MLAIAALQRRDPATQDLEDLRPERCESQDYPLSDVAQASFRGQLTRYNAEKLVASVVVVFRNETADAVERMLRSVLRYQCEHTLFAQICVNCILAL